MQFNLPLFKVDEMRNAQDVGFGLMRSALRNREPNTYFVHVRMCKYMLDHNAHNFK